MGKTMKAVNGYGKNTNSLVLFMSTLPEDDLEMIEGVDYDNVLDMNVRLTDVYLNKLKNTHTKEHMKGAKRGDKYSMKYSYRQLDELKV